MSKSDKQERLLASKAAIESRWQKFRVRLRRLYGPDVESRLIYLDQRWYEIRVCGWNPAEEKIWEWWTSRLHWPARVRLILMSRRCGVSQKSKSLVKPSYSAL